MVMTAHFDESGTHGAEATNTVVAGFLGDVDQWGTYETDLAALLSEFDIKRFHAKKYRAKQGEFAGWEKEKRSSFACRFFPLIDRYLALGISAGFRRDDYASFYRNPAPARGIRLDSEYGLCFRVCLLWAISFLTSKRTEWPLNIVMEQGHKNAGGAVEIFNEVTEALNGTQFAGLLGSISFSSKDMCLSLAMADALAHGVYRSDSAQGSLRNTIVPTDYKEVRIQNLKLDQPALASLRELAIRKEVLPATFSIESKNQSLVGERPFLSGA
ncbi:DUF3800 domain-containing protein [Mesorhizobium sp. M7A.F.Ca.US.011.01.1.1]|uniref:DUF3800 domain-containing protein n=1 Tax=Mesorhizobium sp. M7A.F.Ca.US.011.01.1.1 TaxID=2496741 RepID=UPI000FCCAE09|nr:DUF3800 domain-containing protein [Mesorhizobium sp. M7A.F.Ca.US.011.01.1.1]RUX32026.1 DUF3800 domain-containing protein [Mesorhizobium sp. M7A.F.Ca.US.011.01.1.1]